MYSFNIFGGLIKLFLRRTVNFPSVSLAKDRPFVKKKRYVYLFKKKIGFLCSFPSLLASDVQPQSLQLQLAVC